MEQFYQKVINNNLNEIDKVQLRLILKKYSHRLEKYNETLEANFDSVSLYPSIDIQEEVIKVKGRPKGTGKFTPEELRERARLRSKRYYDENIEKERERKRMDYHSKKKDNSDN